MDKILIINRWDDEFSRYNQFLDHNKYMVSYISSKTNFFIPKSFKTTYVDDLSDKEQMVIATNICIKSMNGITKIIAMSEYDLEMAAYLRTIFNIPGIDINKVRLFRDKVAMKSALSKTNINYPTFRSVECISDILEFASQQSLPIIIKPRNGAASVGVVKIENLNDLHNISNMNVKNYECEKFINGSIVHVDGAIANGRVLFCFASKYINSCLDFSNGMPLGSVMIDDKILNKKIQTITMEILSSLDLNHGIFHLELIITPQQEIYFLEIGARCGGGEIPFVLNEYFGINMFALWMKLELNELIQEFQYNHNIISGFLMFPTPKLNSSLVIKTQTRLIDTIKYLTYEKTPTVGSIINHDSCHDPIACYRFIGHSTIEVEHAIKQTISMFKLN